MQLLQLLTSRIIDKTVSFYSGLTDQIPLQTQFNSSLFKNGSWKAKRDTTGNEYSKHYLSKP